MIFQLLRRGRRRQTIDALYGAIVAQARHPEFYRDFGVPDTVDGRFEMIVLHIALFVRRVRSEPDDIRTLGQEIFDRFCADMDHSLREMGVGDLAVPKRMKGIGEAFYGRAQTYDRALAGADTEAVAATLSRNVFAASDHPGARRLAAYVTAAERHLAGQGRLALAGGTLDFPAPIPISGEDGDEVRHAVSAGRDEPFE
jgi:cytochrome b pre-mRNA-processing protein 3